MQILVISDIHSNLTALESVLEDAGRFDEVWCLGDVVGYGPEPNACVEKIMQLDNLICVLGNHDAAVLGRIDINAFNNEAKRSLIWQRGRLSEKSQLFLESLPDLRTLTNTTLVHGSPRNPVWEYIMDTNTASKNFSAFSTHACLVGHTHVPSVFQLNENNKTDLRFYAPNIPVKIHEKFILNPGSVGQPRDRDSRAAYVLHDSEDDTWEFKRVEYDVERVQFEILQNGLPRLHAYRLIEGI